MAKRDLFQKVDQDKISKLPFNKGTCYFSYEDKKQKDKLGIIYLLSEDSREKLSNLLKGNSTRQLVNKERIYVLNGCKIPMFRIKEYARLLKGAVTNNIEDATVIIGNHNYIEKLMGMYDYPIIDGSCIIMELPVAFGDIKDLLKEDISDKLILDDVVDKIELNKIKESEGTASKALVYTKNTKHLHSSKYQLISCMTPYGAKLAYEILSRKLNVINEDEFINQLPKAIKLDSNMLENIMEMLSSYNSNDRVTACELLANCDYSDSFSELYHIAKSHYYTISSYTRSKNVALFFNKSKLQDFYNLEPYEFIFELIDKYSSDKKFLKNELDKIIPEELSEVINDIKMTISTKLFNIKVELRDDIKEILDGKTYSESIPAGEIIKK